MTRANLALSAPMRPRPAPPAAGAPEPLSGSSWSGARSSPELACSSAAIGVLAFLAGVAANADQCPLQRARGSSPSSASDADPAKPMGSPAPILGAWFGSSMTGTGAAFRLRLRVDRCRRLTTRARKCDRRRRSRRPAPRWQSLHPVRGRCLPPRVQGPHVPSRRAARREPLVAGPPPKVET